MMPNYLVIGAQKCATSSICDLLAAHPDVFMTEPKEPHFFSHPEVWARGFAWYESLFEGAQGKPAVGEGSTTYTQNSLWPEAPERIAKHLPDAKLIYIVRNPLERIQSHYLHLQSKGGRETRPFNEAVRARPEYIDNSLYLKQIDLYRAHFPDERILVLFFDDFRVDAEAVMRRVYGFVGVDPNFKPSDSDRARHVSAEGRIDSSATRALRRIPKFSRMRDAAPMGLRNALRRVFKKPIAGRPEWDAPTKRWAIERLADDNREFLRRCGKPESLWGVDWGA